MTTNMRRYAPDITIFGSVDEISGDETSVYRVFKPHQQFIWVF